MSTDAPIGYMARTRAYYAALGFDQPYRWAQFSDVPFSPTPKPLSQCMVALVTTAAPFQVDKGDQGPGAPYNAAAKFHAVYEGRSDSNPDLRISHVAIDRDHTTAGDQNSYFPLPALRRAAGRGRIGGITPHFFGLPTNRSQRATADLDVPDLLRRLRADGADAAIFVPNCPVCHQSVSLAARASEAAGLATVIMGCAKDIVEHVGVPRFVFSDFPLGNAAGIPFDVVSQDRTLELALDALESAAGPRHTFVSPLQWPGPPGWKADYCNVSRLTDSEIAARRKGFDRDKAIANAARAQLQR